MLAASIATALPFLLALACPLMMIFMMRGMHRHGGRGQTDPTPRERMSMDELKHARDELNEEIAERASK